MENVENQTAVSRVSHRPLEIAQGAIPTFPPRRRRFSPIGTQNQRVTARALRALTATPRKRGRLKKELAGTVTGSV
jgi:hypothetical protein